MNIKDLEYFHQLVLEKNFSKVATYFNVSQPTITLAIKRLEEEFQTPLFERDRSHKKLHVTLAGQQLDQHVSLILNELTLAKKEVLRTKEEKLLFGLPPIIGNYFFPTIVTHLISSGLIAQFHTTEAGSDALLKLLLDGSIDFCLLGSLEPLTQRALNAETFASTEFKIIVSKKHPLAQKKAVHFAELKNEQFIVHNEGFIHDKALRLLARHNHFTPDIIYQTNYVHVLKSMVQSNTGIACLSEIALSSNDDLAVLDLLDEDRPKFLLSIVMRSNQLLTPTKEKLLQILRESVYQNK